MRVLDGLHGREQAEDVHVDVVGEKGKHIHGAKEVAQLALALQLDTQQDRVVAQADDEHRADLLEQVDENAALGIGEELGRGLGRALLDEREVDAGEAIDDDAAESARLLGEIDGRVEDLLGVVDDLTGGVAADEQILEYLEDVVGVGGVDDAGEEAIALAERTERYGQLESTRAAAAAAAACEPLGPAG